MKLLLVDLQNRPIVTKLIRYDSSDIETRQIVSTQVIPSLEAAPLIAGDDWDAGKAFAINVREFEVGDIYIRQDGAVVIRTSNDTGLILNNSEFSGDLPDITVDDSILNSIPYKVNQPRIKSIVDGEMTLWP